MPRPAANPTLRSDAAVLAAFAALILIAHFFIGNGYGFHRDELQFLDDGFHLHWGFVAYPPLTAFCGRVAVALFGISPQVFRLPAALADAAALVLIGLTARELGGRRPAQLIAAAAAFHTALAFSSLMQYNSFDFFAVALTVFCTARVLSTGDARLWTGAGVGIGLGVLSKYSIAFPVAGLLTALIVLPSQRHHLRSRWFWYGLLAATVIAAPNLIWLVRHHFITLQMEHSIHARDIRLGRTAAFYPEQIKFTLFAFPLAVAGFISLLRSPRFRLLIAFFLAPLILFTLLRGRAYYMLSAYPVLYAAGAVALERALSHRPAWLRISARSIVFAAFALDAALVVFTFLPIWPPHSHAWTWQMANNGDSADEIGWPELVAQVAAVRDTLPAEDLPRLGILVHNYGEAGAVALYGPQYHLPAPISSTNSFFFRGWGPYDPETVIILGSNLPDQLRNFQTCTIVAQIQMPYGVRNEESRDHPDILVCRHLRLPWAVVWKRSLAFG
jgi:uncharacterized membrane protein